MKILCIGQSAYDITLPVSEYPEENKKYKTDNIYECGGGSCNNAAYLLGKWNNDVSLISSVGNDLYGKRIISEQQNVGVDTSNIEIINDLNTTISFIINNLKTGSRTIITSKNPLMYKRNNTTVLGDVILLDGHEIETAKKIINDNPKAVKIIDAGSFNENTINLCKYCDYIVCSNDFAKDYSKINFSYDNIDEIKLAYDIIQKDFNGKLIITLESMGCITKVNNDFFLVPSINVKGVDSTGAGDIYHGAFTYFISHNYSLLDAMRYSNIAGALSVCKIGSKNSMPTLSEVINYHE